MAKVASRGDNVRCHPTLATSVVLRSIANGNVDRKDEALKVEERTRARCSGADDLLSSLGVSVSRRVHAPKPWGLTGRERSLEGEKMNRSEASGDE
jgi:hypothetical protein